MGCKTYRDESGVTAIICSRGGRRSNKPCGIQPCVGREEYLCDWPIGSGKTCDKSLCAGHRRSAGPNRDYCPEHFSKAQAERENQSQELPYE